MQKISNVKSTFFLTLCASLFAANIQAATADKTNNDTVVLEQTNNAIPEQELDLLLNTMDEHEQEKFMKLLDELEKVSENRCPKNNNALGRFVCKILKDVPFAKISSFTLRLAIAIWIWECAQPSLKKTYEKTSLEQTAIELPKIFAAALVIDGMKDLLKEVRLYIEDKVNALYVSLTA